MHAYIYLEWSFLPHYDVCECIQSITITCVYLQKRGGLKGQVDLSKVKAIEKVQDGQFDKPSFQVIAPSLLFDDVNAVYQSLTQYHAIFGLSRVLC